MEHLSHKLKMDPLEFRMINMSSKGETHPIQDIVKKLKESSKFDKRKAEVEKFNQV